MAKIKKSKQKYTNNLTNPVVKNYGYDIQYPESKPVDRKGIFDFPFSEGDRFFYFISLLDYQGQNYPGYDKLMAYGKKAYDLEEQDKLNEGQWDEKLRSILDVIHGFKQYEATNERRLFEEKIKPLLEADPDRYEAFLNIFDGDSIDYTRFMALLKILNSDIKTVKQLLKDLEVKMKAFNTAYSAALDEKVRQEKLDYKSDRYHIGLNNRDELTDNIHEILNKLELNNSEYSKIFKALAADAEKIANTTDKGEIIELKDLNNIIISMIKSGKSAMSINNLPKQFTAKQMNALKLAIYQRIHEYASAREKNSHEIIYNLSQAIQNCASYMNEEDKMDDSSMLSDLNKYLFECIDQLDDITKMWDKVQSVLSSTNRLYRRKSSTSQEQIAGLIKPRREKILRAIAENPHSNKKALKQLQQIEDSENKSIYNPITKRNEKFDIRKKEHFKIYIDLLKQAMNTTKNVDNLIKTLNVMVVASEAKKATQLVTVASETGGLLDMKFITNTLGKVIGEQGLREDSILIGYATHNLDGVSIEPKILKGLQNASQYEFNQYTSTISKESRAYNKRFNKEYGSNAYDIMGTTLAAIKLDESTATKLKNDLHLNSLEEAYKELSNIMVIENSTKFATTFNTNEYGFSGGSLGADLIQQIENINNMLLLGGITPADSEFLINAIMNAGPGMLGYHQKDKLEMYLSSLASICMFSSGGQALLNYTNEVKRNLKSLGATKIHIFNVGTMYVPLSYILSLMEQGMMRCFESIEDYALGATAGNKVTIYNPVNEAQDKISTLYSNSQGKTFTLGDWQATATQGLPKVTLNMAILGGFLDVLNSINKFLNNIV